MNENRLIAVNQKINPAINQIELSQIELRELKPHDLKKLVLQSSRNPQNTEFLLKLSRHLWDTGLYKELLDLIPVSTPENLESVLRLQCQCLLRQAFAEGTLIKRLIPVALSYAAFLDQYQKESLLENIDQLVAAKNNKALAEYYLLNKNIYDVLHAKLSSKNDPLYLLLPETVMQLDVKFKKKIQVELAAQSSSSAIYYAEGGHYIFLAEGEFSASVEARNKKLISDEINAIIEIILIFKKEKKIIQHLKPHLKQLSISESAQSILVSNIRRYAHEKHTTANENKLRAVATELADLAELLKELIDMSMTSTYFNRVEFCYLDLRTLVIKLIPQEVNPALVFEVLNFIKKLMGTLFAPDVTKKLADLRHQLLQVLFLSCLKKGDVQTVFKILDSSFKEEFYDILIKDVDEFRDDVKKYRMYSDETNAHAQFYKEVLSNYKLQKRRIKDLNQIIKY